MEAIPQIHILLTMFMLNPVITHDMNPQIFKVTFASSVFTATLGIAKFLKTGPCRLVPDQGPMGGHATLAFLFLMVNIASTILTKGFMLPAIGIAGKPLFDTEKDRFALISVWLAVCYLPQLIYVSTLLHKFQ